MQGDTLSRKDTQVKIVPLGYNSTASSDLMITSGSQFGDLADLIAFGGLAIAGNTGKVQKQNLVRLPKPYSGDINQLYLTFRLRLGDDEPSTRTMWVGFANADKGDPTSLINMSEDAIKRAHAAIFGDDTGIQAGAGQYIQFNRVNIAPLLKRQQSGRGIYGLVFLFDQKPKRDYDSGNFDAAIDNGYHMQVFRLEGVIRFKGTI